MKQMGGSCDCRSHGGSGLHHAVRVTIAMIAVVVIKPLHAGGNEVSKCVVRIQTAQLTWNIRHCLHKDDQNKYGLLPKRLNAARAHATHQRAYQTVIAQTAAVVH